MKCCFFFCFFARISPHFYSLIILVSHDDKVNISNAERLKVKVCAITCHHGFL